MNDIQRLIFEHRSCIKKLKVLIHPDKRPNDRLQAEEEWKQLDTVLSNLTIGYPVWQELSNWQDFQYVVENIAEFKSQLLAIVDGALSISAIVQYVNMELDLTGILHRFDIDFKSRYSSLNAKQVDDVIQTICGDLRLMNDDLNYQPCIIQSHSILIEENIVVNDNKFWKQLMCQKLGLKVSEYQNHFIVDWCKENSQTNNILENVNDYVQGFEVSSMSLDYPLVKDSPTNDPLVDIMSFELFDDNVLLPPSQLDVLESQFDTSSQVSISILDPIIVFDTAPSLKPIEIVVSKKRVSSEDEDSSSEVSNLLERTNLKKKPKQHKKAAICPQWFEFKSRPISLQAKRYYLQCKKKTRKKLDNFGALLKITKNPLSTAPHYFDAALRLLDDYGLQKCLNNNVEELLQDRKDINNFRGALFAFRRFYSSLK